MTQLLKLLKEAMERRKPSTFRSSERHHQNKFMLGGFAYDANYIATLGFDDARVEDSNCLFEVVLPLDRWTLSICSRTADKLSVAEKLIAQDWEAIVHQVPWHSFSCIAHIHKDKMNLLVELGELGVPRAGRPYHQLALRVGQFHRLLSILSNHDAHDAIAILCYFVPAFIFPLAMRSIREDWQPAFRNDRMTLPSFMPNFNIDNSLRGWQTDSTFTVTQMVEFYREERGVGSSEVLDLLRDLFESAEEAVDTQLERYSKNRKEKGSTRIQEIFSGATTQSDKKVPDWWPIRLVDVFMDAIIPGENVWHFRQGFNTLSYTWEHDGTNLEQNRPWFSSQSVPLVDHSAYGRFRQTASQIDSSEYIWVDAICINQHDHIEIGREVSRSAGYYQHCNKCLVLPEGLSNPSALNKLQSPCLPRWFERVWTLQEAAASNYLLFKLSDRLLDRYEVLDLIDQNRTAPDLLVTSSRHVLRREALGSLGDISILCWALCRNATRPQDTIYGIKALLSIGSQIEVNYAKSLPALLLELATRLSPEDRTSFSALSSVGGGSTPSWLPGRECDGFRICPAAKSTVKSYIVEDTALELRDVHVLEICELESYDSSCTLQDAGKPERLGDKVGAIETLAFKCSERKLGYKHPADNALARAWVAITYSTSTIMKAKLQTGRTLILRVMTPLSAMSTHLLYVGMVEDSLYREMCFLCVSKEGSRFRKVGIVATLEQDMRDVFITPDTVRLS